MRKFISLLACVCVLLSCQEDQDPKPRGYLALTFPAHTYKKISPNCPYVFKVNEITKIKPSYLNKPCQFDIVYPTMKGTVYISYKPVHNNLKKLLADAQELPLKHTIKANQIIGDKYTNRVHDTYGMFYTVTGNAASQAQFYLTDSVNHFITGSLYFRLEPNYDSIYPAAQYIMADMKKMMESLRWKN